MVFDVITMNLSLHYIAVSIQEAVEFQERSDDGHKWWIGKGLERYSHNGTAMAHAKAPS
jgi:hypothetical protein